MAGMRNRGLPGYAYVTALLLIFLSAAANPFLLSQEVSSAHVDGSVHDAEGYPIAGVSIIFQQDSGPTSLSTTSLAGGQFSLTIPPGLYTVRVAKVGYVELSHDSVELAPNEKKRFDPILQSAKVPPLSSAGIELNDQPNFTVAGMSDSTGSGGHGSETRIRTGDVLAKDTMNLESGASRKSSQELFQARDQIQRRLAAHAAPVVPEEAALRRELADIDEKLNDPLAAQREYERATMLQSSESNYFVWGAELLLHGATAPAIEVFSKGAHLYPRSSRMLAGLGAALYASGSAEAAAQRLCQAADLEPESAAPYLFLGKIQEAATTPLPCAEERLARFAGEQPENPRANYYYAIALWKEARGKKQDNHLLRVEALLEKSIALNPRFDEAFLQLGKMRFNRGAVQGAIAAYRHALMVNPSNSEAHYRLGLAYKRIGEDAKAKREIQTYKELDEAEATKLDRQRKELGQFIFVLKDPATDSSATADPHSN